METIEPAAAYAQLPSYRSPCNPWVLFEAISAPPHSHTHALQVLSVPYSVDMGCMGPEGGPYYNLPQPPPCATGPNKQPPSFAGQPALPLYHATTNCSGTATDTCNGVIVQVRGGRGVGRGEDGCSATTPFVSSPSLPPSPLPPQQPLNETDLSNNYARFATDYITAHTPGANPFFL